MEFFNFGSDEAYELFEFLTTIRRGDLENLVRQSQDDVDNAEDSDPVESLAKHIEQYVSDLAAKAGYADYGAGPIDEIQPGDVLASRLLKCSVQRIDFCRVAKALLMKTNGASASEED